MDEKEIRHQVLRKLAYKNMSFKDLQEFVKVPPDQLKTQLLYLRKRKLVYFPDENAALIDLIKPKYSITQDGFKYLDELENPPAHPNPSQFVVHAEKIDTLVQGSTINNMNIDAVFLEVNKRIDNDRSLSYKQKEQLKSNFDNLKKVLNEIKEFGSPVAGQLIAEVIKKLLGMGA